MAGHAPEFVNLTKPSETLVVTEQTNEDVFVLGRRLVTPNPIEQIIIYHLCSDRVVVLHVTKELTIYNTCLINRF